MCSWAMCPPKGPLPRILTITVTKWDACCILLRRCFPSSQARTFGDQQVTWRAGIDNPPHLPGWGAMYLYHWERLWYSSYLLSFIVPEVMGQWRELSSCTCLLCFLSCNLLHPAENHSDFYECLYVLLGSSTEWFSVLQYRQNPESPTHRESRDSTFSLFCGSDLTLSHRKPPEG